jgi:AcrR family transcriptional regulator
VCEALDAFGAADDPAGPRAAKRRRIVRAATELFLRRGYRKTSVDEVARAAGMAKGTFYLYFRTKSELAVQAVVEEKRHFLRRIEPVFAAPPGDRLERWLAIALEVAAEMPLTTRLRAREEDLAGLVAEMDPEVRERSDRVQLDFLSELIELAAAPHRFSADELADRARALRTLVLGATSAREDVVGRGMAVARHARLVAQVLVHGAITPAAAPPPGREGGDHGGER